MQVTTLLSVGVRLNEIAERTGVSTSTVSRVLNDRPGVNDHTRRKVLTAIDIMGYDRPVRLRGRSAGLIGLIIPELDNPFFPRLAHHLELNLARLGLTPVLCSQSLAGFHEDDHVQSLLDHAVSGIVFVSGIHAITGTSPDRYQRLIDRGLPIVLVNGALQGLGAHCVSTDDVASVDLALQHLVHMGHRRIGIALGQPRFSPVQRKAAAFSAGLIRHDLVPKGLDLDDLIECATFTPEGGVTAADRLLDRGVTGILCGSDVMALGVIRAVRARGLRVPEDVSVVGSDDSVLVEFTDPPLTTVRQPAGALADAVCRELSNQISGAQAHAGEVLLPPELVVRGSTAPAPRTPTSD